MPVDNFMPVDTWFNLYVKLFNLIVILNSCGVKTTVDKTLLVLHDY